MKASFLVVFLASRLVDAASSVTSSHLQLGTTTSTQSHSSRPSSASVSSSAKHSLLSTNSLGCPEPYNTTTYSGFNDVTSLNTIATTTSTTTLYPTTTSYFSTPYETTTYKYIISSTITSTITSFRTVLLVSPAQTTVSVPTVSGFLPILCDPSHRNPTIVTTNTIVYNVTSTATVTTSNHKTTMTQYGYSSTLTHVIVVTLASTTIQTVTTVTSTSTRADPTQTVYAACASNNITPYEPSGQYIANVNFGPSFLSRRLCQLFMFW
ncbi:hypothetical protein AMS68_008071 [Peltaster fructicola]|uniref:Uncharacterized protein n=1 Tax=Peltaster fructicola TaxID=286661 RepID=A0A6H0Y6A4_9PEZI|nr:hypothetical protein AMS68_008071 [Peltaster fructicola]